MKDNLDRIICAAEHHSDLNIFGAVVAIMEGGCLYTRSGQRMAERIIKLCVQEEQRQLKAYDKECDEDGK